MYVNEVPSPPGAVDESGAVRAMYYDAAGGRDQSRGPAVSDGTGGVAMHRLVAVLLVFLSFASAGQAFPPEPDESELIDPQVEMANLGRPIGVWEGSVEPLYDPVGMNRLQREGYTMRLTIRAESAELLIMEADGQPRPLDGEVYMYQVDNTVLVSYVLANGAFVEYQSLALGQVERNTLKGYLSRIVHNLVVPNSSPWRLVPVYGMVNLERVQ